MGHERVSVLVGVVGCTLSLAQPSLASVEEWRCELHEPSPSTSRFVYVVAVEDSLTARIEVSPSTPGANPRDDAESGTSRAVVLQNSADGLVLASGGTGPTAYGRAAYGSLLVLNRKAGDAVQSYVLAGEKVGFGNPPRLGNCTRR